MIDIHFTLPAAPIMVPVTLAAVAATVIVARRRGTGIHRLLLLTAFTVYLAGVIAVTFFPFQVFIGRYASGITFSSVQLIPVITIDLKTFLLNIVLFVPFGMLVPLVTRWRTARAAITAGAVVSVSIELGQLVTSVLLDTGRACDVNDVIANTLGTAAGFGLYVLARRTGLLARWVPPTAPGSSTGGRARSA